MEIPSTQTGKLYRTTDGGETWSEVYSASGYITGIEISALDPDQIIFTTQTDVYKSKQGGDVDSWQMITPPESSGIRTVQLSPHKAGVYVIGTNNRGIYYTADGGITWRNNQLEDLFAQRSYQGSNQYLDAEIATAFNPGAQILRNISAIVFDPVTSDVFYVAGTQYSRASFGVAKITNAGQNWQRLPLEGLAHRNIFDLAIDSSGTFLYAATFDSTYRFRLRVP